MKKIFSIFLLLGIFSTQVYAKRGVSVGTREELKKVATLPRTDDYKVDAISYMDLGIFYKQLVLGGPVWVTQEPVFVGLSTSNKDVYYELTDEDLKFIAKENNLNLEELKKLSFTERYLGAIIMVVLILGFFLYYYFKSDKNEDVINDTSASDEHSTP